MNAHAPRQNLASMSQVVIGSKTQIVLGERAPGSGYLGPLHSGARPCLAMELTDGVSFWPDKIAARLATRDPFESWARLMVETQADLGCLALSGAVESDVRSYARDVVKIAEQIMAVSGLPLVLRGTGDAEVDNVVLPEVAGALAGQRLLIGPVTEHNYREIALACVKGGHAVVAESPIDINIAKQLNILLTELGVPLDSIVMDPTSGGLGYGIEYTYSIMEKARLAAIQGDKMLSCPMICFVGAENWKLKEASTEWEAAAAVALIMSSAQIVVMRDPEAIGMVARQLELLWSEGANP